VIGIQASVKASSEKGRVIIDFTDPPVTAGIVIDVNGRSLNCSAEHSPFLPMAFSLSYSKNFNIRKHNL
jgi:hypothetical protein